MPAVSKKQQKFFGIVRSVQKGEQSPTTPEVAKAASSMKKGDVKKFASTKHKGLPEKKKIVEDKQIKKIIKQLRKSVKSHDKQADTLEKKVKTFKESAFTNITTGMKVGQTFQHISGATVTVDNTMSNSSDQQQTVSISGEPVSAPTGNQLGVAGVTMPLGNKKKKKKDKTVLQNNTTKTAAQINQQLDASKKASGAQTAKVEDSQETKIQKITDVIKKGVDVIKNLANIIDRNKPSSQITELGIQVVYQLAKELTEGRQTSLKTDRFNSELKVLFGYLSGKHRGNISNANISENHLNDLFKTATLTTDGSGRVQMDDFIVGSGQKLVFTPNNPYNFGSSLDVSLEFNYDFDTNAVEIMKSHQNVLTKVLGPILFGNYAYDAKMFGRLVQHAKDRGNAKPIKGKFNISMNKLFELNPKLVQAHMAHNNVLEYFAKPWTVDMMRQSMATGKPVGEVPAIKAGVHAYYALTGQLPPQSVAIGSPEYYNLPPKWNFGDHPEYDPEVIAAIDERKRNLKYVNTFGKVGGGNAGSYKPTPTDSEVFDRDDVSFKKKDYEKNRGRGYQRLAVTDPNRPARRVDPSKIVGRGYRAPKGTPRSQIVGRSYGSRGRTRRGKSDLDKAKKRLIRVLSASYSMLEEAPPKVKLKDTGNPIQNMWNKFVPPPESSNNPNVRSGLRQPGKLEAGALKNLNQTAKNINKPIKVTSKTVKTAKSVVGGIQKGLDFVKANPGKTALIGAGVVGAGMLAKKALTRNKDKEVKEQTTFPQMQERIRNAKERRREQQKKSEKLYMDTKKKGVKFYDKKGSGRLKDGKKVYD